MLENQRCHLGTWKREVGDSDYWIAITFFEIVIFALFNNNLNKVKIRRTSLFQKSSINQAICIFLKTLEKMHTLNFSLK